MSRTCRSFQSLACLAAMTLVGSVVQNANAQLTNLWDTGVEFPFNSGATCPCGGAGQPVCTDFFLGFSAGNIAGAPQRWSVQPFKINNATGATVTEIHVHGFYPAGNEPQNINYIIWRRFGNTTRTDPVQAVAPDCATGTAICNTGALLGANLEAPINGDQVATGSMTALVTGETDPRGGSGGALYKYKGLCIPLAAGEYYLTVYGDGFRAGNTSGQANFAWFGGAHQPDTTLIRAAMWRSVSFPTPGFAQYNPGTLCMDNAAPFPSGEPRDVWTQAFALYGFTNHVDCNANSMDDFCEPGYADCNNDGIADFCQVNANSDCDNNGTLDVCEGGFNDVVHYVGGQPVCDGVGDGINDRCQPGYADCNTNNQADCFDVSQGASPDCNGNGRPDECDAVTLGDCNTNGVPDTCELTGNDCDNNGVLDLCEMGANLALDCNANGILDRCDIAAATSIDCNSNVIPDECEHDCDTNGIADACDIQFGGIADCNLNGFPDRCDVRTVGTSFRIDQFYVYGTGGGFALGSDATLAAGGSQVVAHDFQSPAGMVVNQINWVAGPNTASGFTAVTDDSFTIRIWTDASGRPGTVVASYNVPGADGTLVRFDNAPADANREYATVLTTPLSLPAGRYWYEAFYTGLNPLDFTIIAEPGRPTSGLDAFPLASIVTVNEPWNFFFNLHNLHLLLAMAQYYPDANSNGVPDGCEFPGACATCRGDVRGVADTDGNKARGDDLNDFVRCLITQSTNMTTNGCGCADITGDGLINGADATAMAQLLLGVSCPTCGTNVCTP